MFSQKQGSHTGKKEHPKDECLICFKKKQKSSDILHYLWQDDLLCPDCRHMLTVVNITILFQGICCHILYEYNDIFSKWLIQYKELYDEAIASIFIDPFIKEINRKYKGYTLVGIPSTQQKMNQRGFDHLEKMFDPLSLSYCSLFNKEDITEQKKSSLIHRLSVSRYIYRNSTEIPQTPLLLVDDTITTGASLSACHQLLKDHPYPIQALILSGNMRNLSENKG